MMEHAPQGRLSTLRGCSTDEHESSWSRYAESLGGPLALKAYCPICGGFTIERWRDRTLEQHEFHNGLEGK